MKKIWARKQKKWRKIDPTSLFPGPVMMVAVEKMKMRNRGTMLSGFCQRNVQMLDQ